MNKNVLGTHLLFSYKIGWGVVFVMFALVFSSCQPTKSSFYFKNLSKDTTLVGVVNPNFESKIQPGDNLGISINSLSTEENLKFNNTVVSAVTATATVPSYLVSKQGTIKMHRFGEVKVDGLTTVELAEKLQNDLLPYLKEPLVNVSFLNHKVTVMGAVNRPGVINLVGNNISLIDALVLSGDITREGKRDDILIVRDNGISKEVKKVNLENTSIFSSPWFYLQPNDIVYVTPDFTKTDKEEQRRNRQTTISLIASGISIIVLILTRLF